MGLNIPFFGDGDSKPYASPRALKKWVKTRSLVNMGETTKDFFSTLQELNRDKMAGDVRLELMHVLRPLALNIFSYLDKHISAQSLPLPKKSQQIAHLKLTIESQMALGYKLGLATSQAAKIELSNKVRSSAIYWGMRFLYASVITAGRLYMSEPAQVWADAYQLYAHARKSGVNQNLIKDDTLSYEKKGSTIEKIFLQMCAFGLTKPYSLRMGDAARLAAFFEKNVAKIEITDMISPNSERLFHMVNLSGKHPPEYIAVEDRPESQHIYQLLLSELNLELRNIKSSAENTAEALKDRAAISPQLADRVLTSWEVTAKRKFKRVGKENEIAVSISLDSIYESIVLDDEDVAGGEDPAELAVLKPQKIPNLSELSLQSISDAQRKPETITPSFSSDNVWDQVSKGNVVSDQSLNSQAATLNQRMALKDEKKPFNNWLIINASAGGYCLRWPHRSSSRAQVGELIALREREGSNFHWRVGIIRWMQFNEDDGLDIGVQLIGPKTILITISEIEGRKNTKYPIRALMLPGIKTVKKPSSIIVPPNTLSKGERIHIQIFNRKMVMDISLLGEHTNNFEQYMYQSASEENDSPQKDEFHELWSNL